MRNMGVNKNLVGWTERFMRDRRVIMSVDGQDSEPISVTTGLPQGSPISPVLFAIYIAEIHGAVKGQVDHCRGISFVGDITWVVVGGNANEVIQRLERCAAASLRWAENNAVRFETSKTEAVLRPESQGTGESELKSRSGWEDRQSTSPESQQGGWASGWMQRPPSVADAAASTERCRLRHDFGT